MERWTRELRRAVRRLARAPVHSLAVTLVIASGVAFASAMSSLASAVMRHAVPYPDAHELVRIDEFNRDQGIEQMQSSLPAFEHWRTRSRTLVSIGAVQAPINLTVRWPDGGSRLQGGLVHPDLFETFRVTPTLGRSFGPEEGTEGLATPSIVISHELWVDRFGRDPDVLGQSMSINGSSWHVVGVLPPATPLDPMSNERIDVWFGLGHASTLIGQDVFEMPNFRGFGLYGRLSAPAASDELDGELAGVSAELFERYPDAHDGWLWRSEPLVDVVTEQLRAPLLTLAVAAAFLSLVCFVNVTGLLSQRARDALPGAGIRFALGADEEALCRWATAELVVLCGPAVVGGLGLGSIVLAARDLWMPFPIPPHITVRTDLGVSAGLVLGALAAVAAASRVMGAWWARESRSASLATRGVSRRHAWSRLGLGVQIAVTTALTVTGLLTLVSLRNLRNADVGMDTDRLLTLRVDVPAEMRTDAEVSPLADEILLGLEQVPVVEEASLWSPHVPGAAVWYSSVRVESRPDLREDGDLPLVRIHQVGSRAVTELGLRFVEGGDFTPRDREAGRRVVIVSESAAREWWGTEPAVGRRIRRWNHDEWATVVGVVADAPLSGRQGDGSDFTRDVYFMHHQDPMRFLVFLARLRDDHPASAFAARQAVQAAVPLLPVYDVRFMDEILLDQERIARSSARLGSVFALAALALVGVGLYGTLAVTVARKAHEISVRKALGASMATIVRQVTLPVWAVWLIGVAAGLFVAWLVLPALVGSALFEVAAQSGRYYLLAAGILLVSAAPGVLGPTLRGARRSPAQALCEQP